MRQVNLLEDEAYRNSKREEQPREQCFYDAKNSPWLPLHVLNRFPSSQTARAQPKAMQLAVRTCT